MTICCSIKLFSPSESISAGGPCIGSFEMASMPQDGVEDGRFGRRKPGFENVQLPWWEDEDKEKYQNRHKLLGLVQKQLETNIFRSGGVLGLSRTYTPGEGEAPQA